MKKLALLAVAFLLLTGPALAQKTKLQLNNDINTLFPDNTTGAITPSKLRTVTKDIVASYVDWLSCTGTGGVVYWSSGTPTCLPPGTSGQILVMTGGRPTWGAAPFTIVAGSGISVGLVVTEYTISCTTFTSVSLGCVPASGGGTVNFLRADGSFTTISLSTSVTGTLQAAQFPALTGDVTTTAGSLVTAIGAGTVKSAMLNADVYSTAHTWSGAQTFTQPVTANSFIPTSSTVPARGLYLPSANVLGFATSSAPQLYVGDGSASIGGALTSGIKLRIMGSVTGSNSGAGIYSDGLIKDDVTSQYVGFASSPSLEASPSLSLPELDHFSALQGTIGAGASISTQRGFHATDSLSGAANNVGFQSDVASGSGNYAFRSTGTARSYLGGNLGVVASGYLNFGTTDGSSGYGLRDSSGTVQTKSSGGSWASVATSSGTLTSGNCVSINGSGNFVDAGTTCGVGNMPGPSLKGNPTNATAAASNIVISSLTQSTSPDVTNDMLLIWDSAAGTYKKINPNTIASASVAGVASIAGNTGAFTLSGGVTNSVNDIRLSSMAANTLKGNGTGSSAAPTDLSVPSCSTATSVLQWVSGTGFQCGSSQLGTVTSVSVTAGTGITQSGSPVTTSGAITVNVDKATTSNYYAGTSNKVPTTDVIYPSEVTVTYGTTTTFDFSTFINASVTLTGNITTMTFSNVMAGKSGTIRFIQDGTGSRTTVWNSNLKWVGGTAPSLSTAASAVDVLSYSCQTTSFCTAALLKDMK